MIKTTKPLMETPLEVRMVPQSDGKWKYIVVWSEGSEVYGFRDTFQEAYAAISTEMICGEQPL